MKYTAIQIPSCSKQVFSRINRLASLYWGASFSNKQLMIPICWLSDIQKKLENILPEVARELKEGKEYQQAWKLSGKYLEFAQIHNAMEAQSDENEKHDLRAMSHQKVALKLLRTIFDDFGTNALLADEPGGGKTISAILCSVELNARKVVVVAPTSVLLNWKKEYQKFSNYHKQVEVGKTFDKRLLLADVIIVNPGQLTKLETLRKKYDTFFDFLIVDECHDFSSAKAKRSVALKSLVANTRNSLFMSGTPVDNYPASFLFILSLIDPKFYFHEDWKFFRTFCNLRKTAFGWDKTGLSNARMFNKMLTRCYMIRRLKSQFDDLPEKDTHYVPVTANQQLVSASLEIVKRIGNQRMKKASEHELRKLLAGQKGSKQTRQSLGLEKIPAVVSFANDLLEKNKQVVIFGYHREVVAELIRNFPDCCYIIGGMRAEERQQAKEEFQAGSQKIIVLSLMAANTGITLTAAHHIIFTEMDYRSKVLEQGESRIHRLTQEEDCYVYYFYCKDTLDEYVLRKALMKESNIQKIVKS